MQILAHIQRGSWRRCGGCNGMRRRDGTHLCEHCGEAAQTIDPAPALLTWDNQRLGWGFRRNGVRVGRTHPTLAGALGIGTVAA